jgi:urease accessory protein
MQLLDLLQIADSSFPSGSYAHSFGLEALYVDGEVDLEAHAAFVLLNSLARLELPMVREAFGAHEPRDLVELDRLMDVLLPVREFRLASRSIGRSFLRAARRIRPFATDASVASDMEHYAVVFGAVVRHWELDLDDSLHVYAWQAIRQQLSAAQRLGKIGQSGVQDLLHRLKPTMGEAVMVSRSIQLEQAGTFAPLLDLAGMAHEQQQARLFVS